MQETLSLHDNTQLPTIPPQYDLLSSITIPPGIKIDPKGIVLILGPNSSGKTQLLKDIHAILTGQARDLVVCSDYQLVKPSNLDNLLDSLIGDGFLKKYRDAQGNEYIQQTAPHLGGHSFRAHNVPANRFPSEFQKMTLTCDRPQRIEVDAFLDLVGHCLTTALFLENRLGMANQCSQFDREKNPPNNDLQALHLNKTAKKRLTEETQQVFGKGVWIDITRGNVLCLRVNQSASVPCAEDRLEPEEMSKFRQIESEGDGMRSYVGICIAMLLGRRPVCIIDEPELCLHPPQANAMGKFIGKYGTLSGHATFVSTHSSHVLRGIIESTDKVQILRLTRTNSEFRGHMIGCDALKECVKRPIVRAETILDGIFADAVTIVESDGDRAVYQAAWEGLRAQPQTDPLMQSQTRRDILFIPVGGTGGIIEITKFYRALRIPTAIIADLDLLMDRSKFEAILDIAGTASIVNMLQNKCRELSDEIKRLPPSVSEVEVKRFLTDLISKEIDWQRDDDLNLKNDLGKIRSQIDRMRRLKRGGLNAFRDHQGIHSSLEFIIDRCKSFGLFLVPVGELEHWAPNLMNSGPSKERKSEWANEAAMKIREQPDEAPDLLKFMREMAAYHSGEALRMS